MQQTYTITGMHCGKCVARLTEALQPLAENISISLNPPQATLTSGKPVSLTALNTAAAKAGNYTLALTMAPSPASPDATQSWLATYRPLLIILAYLAVIPLAAGGGWHGWMTGFMAGFFLLFSFFKMLDLQGFANAYAGYDLLARRSRAYALTYPFIELALGLAYLFQISPTLTNLATIIVMGFGSLGVINALKNKQNIRCACLGTVLNLPMSTVTLVEDLLMVAMATLMLVLPS